MIHWVYRTSKNIYMTRFYLQIAMSDVTYTQYGLRLAYDVPAVNLQLDNRLYVSSQDPGFLQPD